jgi:hypothetical protein
MPLLGILGGTKHDEERQCPNHPSQALTVVPGLPTAGPVHEQGKTDSFDQKQARERDEQRRRLVFGREADADEHAADVYTTQKEQPASLWCLAKGGSEELRRRESARDQ